MFKKKELLDKNMTVSSSVNKIKYWWIRVADACVWLSVWFLLIQSNALSLNTKSIFLQEEIVFFLKLFSVWFIILLSRNGVDVYIVQVRER